jgi:hypothetical protein
MKLPSDGLSALVLSSNQPHVPFSLRLQLRQLAEPSRLVPLSKQDHEFFS